MIKKYHPHRFWILILIMLAASGLVWLWLVAPGQVAETAESMPDGQPAPIWYTFRLTDEPVLWLPIQGGSVDVYENYILWFEEDYLPLSNGGTPSCVEEDSTVQPLLLSLPQNPVGRSDFDICIYDKRIGLISRLMDSDSGDIAPAMYGDWIAFQREDTSSYHLVLYNIVSG